MAQKAQAEMNCERCGQPFGVRPSRVGRTRYCSRACRNDPWETVSCAGCGADFRRRTASEQRYCSRRCHYTQKQVWRACEVCGKQYRREIAGGERCCSRSCSDALRRRPVELRCECCGVAFAVPRCESERRFCSRDCRDRGLATPPRPCAVCGTEFVVSNGRQRTCSLRCGAELRRRSAIERGTSRSVELVCEHCTKPFRVSRCLTRPDAPQGMRRYCSRACKDAARTQRVLHVCVSCGKRSMWIPSKAKRKYCSVACAERLRGKARRFEMAEKWCPICGVRFGRREDESVANFRKRITCSRECMHQRSGQTQRLVWPRSSPYAPDFTRRLCAEIRARDSHRCRLCENTRGRRPLHVHHIDYRKDNSDRENLITLCQSCHAKTNFNREHWHRLLSAMMVADEAA